LRKTAPRGRFSLKTPSKRSFEGVLREKLSKTGSFHHFCDVPLKTPSKRSFEGVLRGKHEKRPLFGPPPGGVQKKLSFFDFFEKDIGF
jgi:hypothetical protein